MKTVLLPVLLFFSLQAGAFENQDPVQLCSNDKLMQGEIDGIPEGHAMKVWAGYSGDVVGALEFDPKTGEMETLYLCGPNGGFYNVEGNLFDLKIDAIYSDEYDAEIDTYVEDYLLVVWIKSMKFIGLPEDGGTSEFAIQLGIEFRDREDY